MQQPFETLRQTKFEQRNASSTFVVGPNARERELFDWKILFSVNLNMSRLVGRRTPIPKMFGIYF